MAARSRRDEINHVAWAQQRPSDRNTFPFSDPRLGHKTYPCQNLPGAHVAQGAACKFRNPNEPHSVHPKSRISPDAASTTFTWTPENTIRTTASSVPFTRNMADGLLTHKIRWTTKRWVSRVWYSREPCFGGPPELAHGLIRAHDFGSFWSSSFLGGILACFGTRASRGGHAQAASENKNEIAEWFARLRPRPLWPVTLDRYWAVDPSPGMPPTRRVFLSSYFDENEGLRDYICVGC